MDKRLRNLAVLLRQWRAEHGVKEAGAAKELGVSTATWGHWEEGTRFPTANNLVALSEYTRIPIQHFFCPNRSRCPFSGKTDGR
jgi:transcriptional regulator with XRE-family HTH domain